MKTTLGSAIVLSILALACFGQNETASKQAAPAKTGATTGAITPMDAAKAAVAAHGGDKLKGMKSLVLKGSVDLNFNGQNLPAAFSTAISGNKYFFEINNPFQPLKQIYDGQQTFSSMQGFSLPPVTSLGFPLLPRVGDAGYTVSAPADAKKTKNGFRITTPEGFYTDFYVNEKTGQIKGYDSSFEAAGRVITTSVEIEGYQTVDGIVVPTKYSQRFDLGGQVTAYANFKTKQVLVNSPIEDAAFAIPK